MSFSFKMHQYLWCSPSSRINWCRKQLYTNSDEIRLLVPNGYHAYLSHIGASCNVSPINWCGDHSSPFIGSGHSGLRLSSFPVVYSFPTSFVSLCSVDSRTIYLELNLFALLKVFTSSKLVSKAKLKMKLQLKGEGEEARSVFISWLRHPLFWIWKQFFARCGSWSWSRLPLVALQ